MAEIHITAISSNGGPSIPVRHSATIGTKAWPGGGTVPILRLHLGSDTITVWPADPEHIRELGERLIVVANELEARTKAWSPDS